MASQQKSSHLQNLENESIHIIREVVAEFKNSVMLYSVGKDSAVMVRLARKAFYPGKFPFPLTHVDTGYKFPEMYQFRDEFVAKIGARLIIEKNDNAIKTGTHPRSLGVDKCCIQLKTGALLDAIKKHNFDAAFGGARRDEEKSRAKERIFSVRDELGQWDPKNQRPELWNLYNTEITGKQTVRVFPLSNRRGKTASLTRQVIHRWNRKKERGIFRMDLVDYSEEVFDDIVADYREFPRKLDIHDITFMPVSALVGDNVVVRSKNTPWYQGSPVIN